jgi:hypothetical protein
LLIKKLIFNSYKADYLRSLPLNENIETLSISNNSDDELNIYLQNDEKEVQDELYVYFEEKRATKNVSLSV